MTIYDQVQNLLHTDEEIPLWAKEIQKELSEIKELLQQSHHHLGKKSHHDRDYFRFVERLREQMRADIADERYPEIDYFGQKLGINFKGWIYNKESTKALPAHEAFKVYRFLYKHKENLDKYIKIC